MSECITIIFFVKDLDRDAISFTYKGEEIQLPSANAHERSNTSNQILGSNEDELPELVRVRTSFTYGATPEKPTSGSSAPDPSTVTQKRGAPDARDPNNEREYITNPPTFATIQKHATPAARTPMFDNAYLPNPSSTSTCQQYSAPAHHISSIDRKHTTPQAPYRSLDNMNTARAHPAPRARKYGLHTPPPTTGDELVASTTQNKYHNLGGPACFMINTAVWKDEMASTSLQKQSFDGRSFVKCAVNGKVDKERKLLLKKIYEQIGIQGLWDCIPIECHESPRPVPENCGERFLEQVLRSIVRTTTCVV